MQEDPGAVRLAGDFVSINPFAGGCRPFALIDKFLEIIRAGGMPSFAQMDGYGIVERQGPDAVFVFVERISAPSVSGVSGSSVGTGFSGVVQAASVRAIAMQAYR